MKKTIKFNENVNVYEFEKENFNVKFSNSVLTKTWDGLSVNNKLFQKIIVFFISDKIKEGNSVLNKLNIFQMYTFKSNLEDLIERFLNANQNKKPSVTLLKGGGGENRNVQISQKSYQMLINIKSNIDKYLENQKNKSSIKLF